mmetsp:Transcript_65587/g.202990  ORF Transcript_65587/g.202990 Transcript_65587/m.202990 type:complete len:240 (+) Transcript_65587:898-1617(+)
MSRRPRALRRHDGPRPRHVRRQGHGQAPRRHVREGQVWLHVWQEGDVRQGHEGHGHGRRRHEGRGGVREGRGRVRDGLGGAGQARGAVGPLGRERQRVGRHGHGREGLGGQGRHGHGQLVHGHVELLVVGRVARRGEEEAADTVQVPDEGLLQERGAVHLLSRPRRHRCRPGRWLLVEHGAVGPWLQDDLLQVLGQRKVHARCHLHLCPRNRRTPWRAHPRQPEPHGGGPADDVEHPQT